MTNAEELKIFKESIKEEIESLYKEHEDYQGGGSDEIKRNKVKVGYYFTYFVRQLLLDADGGYVEHSDIPDVHDAGVDFVIEDPRNKRVLIGQCKADEIYQARIGNIKKELVTGFWNISKEIPEVDFFNGKTRQVRDMLGDYDRKWLSEKWEIRFCFFSTQKKHELQNKQVENLFFEVWGIEELNEYNKNFISLETSAPEEVQFFYNNAQSFILEGLPSDEIGKTLVLAVPGNSLLSIFREHKHSLFAQNIRQFLGKPKAKLIIDTVKNEKERFFYYNNGITAICEEFEIDNDKVVAKKLQIINGAQTLGSLEEASNEGQLENLKVLMRLIVTENQNIQHKIIRYNNTQRKVEDWDFRSNETIQIYLAEVLKNKYSNQGQRYYYQRKRGVKPPEGYRGTGIRKLDPETLSKILYCINKYDEFDPKIPAVEGRGKLYDSSENSDGLYDELFHSGLGSWSKEYLRKAKFAINLFYNIDKYFKDLDVNDENKNAKGMNFFVMGLFINYMIKTKEKNIDEFFEDEKLSDTNFMTFFNENISRVARSLQNKLKEYSDDNPGSNAKTKVGRDKTQFERILSNLSIH